MDRRRDLEETFDPVVVSNKKLAKDNIKDLIPIDEGLQEINWNLEAKKEPSRPKDCEKAKIC